MFKKDKKTKPSYGIIGLGRFGMALALELAESGADLLVIDRVEELVREMREYTENAFVVENLDKKTLADTGIGNCDVVIICIGEHIDTSILTTLHVTSLGVKKVIAKASSAEHGEILEKLGAEVVYPERDMGVRLAHRLETTKLLDFVQLSEQVNISKLNVPTRMIGKTVIDVNLRKEFGINIIAIENGSTLTELITPDYRFVEGDILFISGSKHGITRFSAWAEQ